MSFLAEIGRTNGKVPTYLSENFKNSLYITRSVSTTIRSSYALCLWISVYLKLLTNYANYGKFNSLLVDAKFIMSNV